MNILLQNGLPEEFEGVEISAHFQNMIQADIILRDPATSDSEKTFHVLRQLYPVIPPDMAFAIRGLEWFFMCGAEKDEEVKGRQSNAKRGFDFNQDANMIFSAFYATYGINLATIDFLHWWEFMALFEGLPQETLMKQVIYWRTANLSELPKAERKHVQKMRSLFALKGPERKPMTIEEAYQQVLDKAAKRFAEVSEGNK